MRKLNVNGDDAAQQQAEALLDSHHVSLNWKGRAADHRTDLGGWTCALLTIGAFGLIYSGFFGVIANLVLYLVRVWSETNATAAYSVNTLTGTVFLCSFLGAFISDAYTGRLWGSIAFQILSTLSISLCTIAVYVTQENGASSGGWFVALTLFLVALSSGSTLPSLSGLGADQLTPIGHDIEGGADAKSPQLTEYFTFVAMAIAGGQIVATTLVTWLVDEKGLWVAGFGVCAAETAASLLLTLAVMRRCRYYKAAGNPLIRVVQVLVAACKKRKLSSSGCKLYEVPPERLVSSIPGCRKLPHTDTLRFLDKAAIMDDAEEEAESRAEGIEAWRLCTVTQVEEAKCLLRVIPVGIASTCVAAMAAQTSTLFTEQAVVMDKQIVVSWLILPSASIHLFSIGGSILTGFLTNAGGSRLLGHCLNGRGSMASPLQIQGTSIVLGIMAMIVAACVESYRLHVVHTSADLISVFWLLPQTFLVGASTNLVYAGSLEFFYNEVSDGMRTISNSVCLLFIGAGNYVSSILVAIVADVTTRDGSPGWIPSDLNDGHVDYFYWSLAVFLAIIFSFYYLYAKFYTSRQHLQKP